ncbi:MAG TPA: hypothetical protein DCE22_02945, partial [Verrucomicrobiales bacterium]|nr:hypothetical protein [Verrucomicrobiales bacterium]
MKMLRYLYIFSFGILLSINIDASGEESNALHWSFLPIQRADLKDVDANPIDMFLAERLQENKIVPNPQSDPISLIRRVAIILTGLPPDSERVDSFVTDYNDNAISAYEKLVNELLESKKFGERWAQHWLDIIRWAETNGSESNLYRKMSWIYRDYVIRSLNEDLPYDQFVRDQLAGDLFGKGDATGFLVAGSHVPAATVGQIPESIRQARADRLDEIIQTVSSSLLGLTMNCARCHDHKFDPITIEDYYA